MTFRYFLLGRFFGKSAQAEVYLALNDPHSFMLVQMLARLQEKYEVELKIFFIWGALPGVTIAPKLHRKWAIQDANLIAEQYHLVKIDKVPSPRLFSTGQQAWQLLPNNINNAEQVFLQTWGGTYSEHYVASTPTITHQVKNQARLEYKGHYCAAAIYFAGDWFVGVDRLFHFEKTLEQHSLITSVSNELLADVNVSKELVSTKFTDFKKQPTINVELQQLEIFLSLRSPYSYLGFVQAIALAERYQLELVIKPVLPLLMRGASIPIAKQKYIYLDALREAKKLNIEFNGFVDPLGDGVINAYSMFAWAQQQGKGKEYMLACFRAVYVENIDLSDTENIDIIIEELALDKQAAHAYKAKNNWQQWADNNQAELTSLAFWGVPCFKMKNFSYWGQDRISILEKEIRSSISTN
ncbi:DsbA family protein [Cognaticolwellia mytili]|uniref:DsbA family protein n=1 Tax=Cognaticolwellia mytili TaxID=1888913 RepID=UPI001301C73B|nr:DsbA family protein [Cognaticolwellia mytili]